MENIQQQTDSKPRRRWLKPWHTLSLGRKVGRVVWMAFVGLWLMTVLQVILGIVFNPPLTPLMMQRFVQQLKDDQRTVNFERNYVPLSDISPNLVTAVIHSEDGLFQYHNGFDVRQMKKAYYENKSGKRFRGGSTISQQTAKNAFLPHSRTLLRKGAEAYYTVLIETFWSKRRIMEVYLNIIEFGDGIYGAEAASQHYFGHSAKTLSRKEASQLAATLPSPLKRNPSHSSPYFRRRAADIQSRYSWGMVDLDNPDPKKVEKYKDQDGIVDFIKWYLKKDK
jgi:monofunctional biosynthetic peptidoglycan transglycosylase